MQAMEFSGPLIRILRLRNNWSLETLSHGICSVSYLSKLEQGKAEINRPLLDSLLNKLGFTWIEDPYIGGLCESLYDAVYSCDDSYIAELSQKLEPYWSGETIGPYYLDLLILRSYVEKNTEYIHDDIKALLEKRQKALVALTLGEREEAYRIFPCALTGFCVAVKAYSEGNYTLCTELLQSVIRQASEAGYVHIHMAAEHYMANSYGELGNMDAMCRHSAIVRRLARALGNEEMLRGVAYNIAATQVANGNYQEAYSYFSGLHDCELMDLHKLAVCCEAMGKRDEALRALDRADAMEGSSIHKLLFRPIRYRIEHSEYLNEPEYGEILLSTFETVRKELHSGYARFHLPWVIEWMTANRQYKNAYELVCMFSENDKFRMP